MPSRLYINNFSSKLTTQLLVGGTTANITPGDGALVAGANGSDWYIGTLRRMSGYKDVAREIVKISNRSVDTLTIVRAQESTTALQFEIGDTLDVDITAASFSNVPSGGFADNETPTGLINSSNTVYTLANTPSPAASLLLFLNGVLQRAGGLEYTLAGLTITFVAGATPQTGDNLLAFYRY